MTPSAAQGVFVCFGSATDFVFSERCEVPSEAERKEQGFPQPCPAQAWPPVTGAPSGWGSSHSRPACTGESWPPPGGSRVTRVLDVLWARTSAVCLSHRTVPLLENSLSPVCPSPPPLPPLVCPRPPGWAFPRMSRSCSRTSRGLVRPASATQSYAFQVPPRLFTVDASFLPGRRAPLSGRSTASVPTACGGQLGCSPLGA